MSITRRNYLLTTLLLTGWLTTSPVVVQADVAAQLTWANGDSLPGELLSAGSDRLRWRSSLFTDPLSVSNRLLDRVAFKYREGAEQSPKTFRLTMHDGNVVYGDLLEINDRQFVINSVRHGTLKINRSAVATLANSSNQSLIYIGLRGLTGWATSKNSAGAAQWQVGEDGRLTSQVRDATLFYPLDASDRAVFDVTLRATDGIAFRLALDDRPNESVRIETWEDELVAVRGYDFEQNSTADDFSFEPLQPLKDHAQELRLQIYLEAESGKLTVFSETGKMLGTLSGVSNQNNRQSEGTARTGLYLQNLGEDISLVRFQVKRGNEAAIANTQAEQAGVRLVNGTIVRGKLTGFDAEQRKLVVQEADGPRRFAIDEVESIQLKPATNETAVGAKQSLSYFDGTHLSGVVTSIKDDVATVQTSFCEEPIVSKLEGARVLRYAAANETSQDAPDRLVCADGSLHGTLVINGDAAQNAIRWCPTGESDDYEFAPNSRARIEPRRDAQQALAEIESGDDVLFLVNGDTVPCQISGIDEKFVHAQTALAETLRVPNEFVQAVELAGNLTQAQPDFGDPGWQVFADSEGKVQLNTDKAVVRQSGGFGHPNVMQGNEIRFDLAWRGKGGMELTLRLYAADPQQSDQCLELLFVAFNESLTLYDLQELNRTGTRSNRKGIKVPDRTASIRVATIRDRIEVTANGKLLWQSRRAMNISGSGIGFAMEDSITPRFGSGKNRKQQSWSISNFKIDRGHTATARARFDKEGRDLALTVPRFRKASPPTHVLLSRNGDLLRGHLTSLDSDKVRFVSRLKNVSVSRKQLAAVVWLRGDDPKPLPQGNGDAPQVRVLLDNGVAVTMSPLKSDDQLLSGVSSVVGRWDVPVRAIRELQLGGYGELDPTNYYADWKPHPAKLPRHEEHDWESESPRQVELVGTQARDFESTMLDGSGFQLSDHTDKVIVLDFWATWCGPCIVAMPKYLEALEPFDPNQVRFVAVNQGEPSRTISTFLDKRGWKFDVVLDQDQSIARHYGVQGIPYTVVIAPGGKVEWVHVGFSKGAPVKLKSVVQSLLDSPEQEDAQTKDAAPTGQSPSNIRKQNEVGEQ